MKRINMTKLALQYNQFDSLEGHTCGQIKQEEIKSQYDKGYHLFQIANNQNQHVRFEFGRPE